ncbi:MAG: hypothetical protein GY749_11930 [Desulfobacteraceae bacterium]|nr:hypothetical protein [Desulfobacteraceae bacterium]
MKTAEFIPHSNLISWLNYKVTIADARDTQGNPLKDDEWSAEKKPEKTFNNFDLNSDGFISPDEVDWQDKIAYFDHDGDNTVSHEEWETDTFEAKINKDDVPPFAQPQRGGLL